MRAQAAPLPGDTTGDGTVTPTDAVAIERHILGIEALQGQPLAQADANGDGAIDAADLVTVFEGGSTTSTFILGPAGGEANLDGGGIAVPPDFLTEETEVFIAYQPESPVVGNDEIGLSVAVSIPLDSINIASVRRLAELERLAAKAGPIDPRRNAVFAALTINSPMAGLPLTGGIYYQPVGYTLRNEVAAFHAVVNSVVMGAVLQGRITAAKVADLYDTALARGRTALEITVSSGYCPAAPLLVNPMRFTQGGRMNGEWKEFDASPSSLPKKRDVVLLVHGIIADSSRWGAVIEGLQNDDALDRPNLAIWRVSYNYFEAIESNGALLSELMDQADAAEIQNIYIAGHSMGTQVVREAVEAALGSGHGWVNKVRRAVYLAGMHDGVGQLQTILDALLTSIIFTVSPSLANILHFCFDSPGIEGLGSNRNPISLSTISNFMIGSSEDSWLTSLYWGNTPNDGWVPVAGAVNSPDFGALPSSHKRIWADLQRSTLLGGHVELWPDVDSSPVTQTIKNERYKVLRDFLLRDVTGTSDNVVSAVVSYHRITPPQIGVDSLSGVSPTVSYHRIEAPESVNGDFLSLSKLVSYHILGF